MKPMIRSSFSPPITADFTQLSGLLIRGFNEVQKISVSHT